MKAEPSRLAFAWFRAEDWERVNAISAERIHDSYAKWLADASLNFTKLRRQGFQVEKVVVDPEELLDWAKSSGIKIDGDARARFVALKLEEKYKQ